MNKQVSKNSKDRETPRERFDIAARAIFDAANPDTQSLFGYVQRLLYQYRLYHSYEVKNILTEVYARGVKKIEGGEEIKIPLAWFRRTSFHVVSEFRREADRVGYCDFEAIPANEENALLGIMADNDRKAIRIAVKLLTPDERRLLHLRVVKGLPWRDVGRALVMAGDAEQEEQAEGTLRQRGYRALSKLRQLYDEVREEIPLDMGSHGESEF
jgi:DNA-directed RNA polymerase specialized sigma24 family protein